MSPRTRYLATTLALLAIGLGYGLSQGRMRAAPPRQPAQGSPAPARLALPPTAEEILGRTEALRLGPEQMARLQQLADAWRAERKDLQAAIREASAEFDRFVIEARTGGGVSIPELQRRSADLQALSAELRMRRSTHSRRAVEILTDAQRELLRRDPVYSDGGRA